MKNKIKRLGLEISIEELEGLIKELKIEQAELCYQLKAPVKINRTRRHIVNIINIIPKCKDGWGIEK